MSVTQRQNDVYGLSQPIIKTAPFPINSQRSPVASDFATPGTIWVNKLTNQVYILASIVANSATWISAAGGPAIFSSLTVTPGPISLTGTTTINTAGAANTTIGAGGTGAVIIGNATGNVTIPAGNLTLTTGNLTLTAGNVVLTLGDLQLNANRVITWSNGISILTGAGSPDGVVLGTQGSLYLRTDGDNVNNRAFINTDGVSAWTGITTAA